MNSILSLKDKKTLKIFSIAIVFSFIGILLYYLTPVFTGFLIDSIVSKGQTDLILIWVIATLIFSFILHTYLFYFLKFLWDKYGFILSNEVRQKIVDKIIHTPNYQYKKFDQSFIFNLLFSDASIVGHVSLTYIASSIVSILRIISCIIILSLINIKLTLVSILFIPAYIMAMLFNRNKLQKASFAEREALDVFIDYSKRLIANKVHINLFKKEVYFKNKFDQKIGKWTENKLKYSFWFNLTREIPSLLTTIAPFMVLAYGGLMVIDGTMTLGKLIMFSQYTNMIFEPLNILAQAIVEKKSNTPIFQRVSGFLNKAEKVKELNKKSLDNKLISIRDYKILNDKGETLFEIPLLDINKTGIYIITGDNGTGKTTFLNILSSVNNPELAKPTTDQSYFYFDHNFFKDFCYLFQPGFIFEGTIRENITFGEEKNNSLDEIIKVLGIKDIDKPISFTPLNLSLGEQQKLQLARIFYQDKDIMLFDEPFSNLDYETCLRLKDYILNKKDKKLFLIISHNQELKQCADTLIEIKDRKLYIKPTEVKQSLTS